MDILRAGDVTADDRPVVGIRFDIPEKGWSILNQQTLQMAQRRVSNSKIVDES